MRKKLITHVNGLFSHAPKTTQAQEIHDEILINTLDRFDEEIAAGHSEDDAYAAAVESIGSVDEILDGLSPEKSVTSIQRAIAIALYVLCATPVIIGKAIGSIAPILGVCAMFIIIGFATYLLLTAGATPAVIKKRQRRALGIAMYIVCVTPVILASAIGSIAPIIATCIMFFLIGFGTYLILTAGLTPADKPTKQLRSLGISLYIVCVTPVILGSVFGDIGPTIGVALMFLLAAAATALVVYPSVLQGGRKQPSAATAASEPAPEQVPSAMASGYWKIFVPVYWVCASGLFFLLGSTVVQWYFAWLVFPIAGALFGIIRAIVHRDGLNSVKQICSALLWLLVILTYFILTLKTEAYFITWLCFPIGAALNGVVSGIFEIKKRRNMK